MTDLVITAANVIAGTGARRALGTAGATITAGKVVYFDSSTSKYKLADNNSGTAPSGTNSAPAPGSSTAPVPGTNTAPQAQPQKQ